MHRHKTIVLPKPCSHKWGKICTAVVQEANCKCGGHAVLHELWCKFSISFCGSDAIFQRCTPVHSEMKLLFFKNVYFRANKFSWHNIFVNFVINDFFLTKISATHVTLNESDASESIT